MNPPSRTIPPPRDQESARLAALSRDALETRTRILVEADRLFRVYGYSKTTVADIAEACRMSPANVYRFFESKSAINNAICERFIADGEQALRDILRLRLPASERLKRFIIEVNRHSLELLNEQKKVHEMVAVAFEERWEAISAHVQRTREFAAEIVKDGIAAGEFRRQDPERAAACIRMTIAPLCHPVLLAQCHDIPDTPTPAEIADFVLAALK